MCPYWLALALVPVARTVLASSLLQLPPIVVTGIAPLPTLGTTSGSQTATSSDIDQSHADTLPAFIERRLGSVHVNEMQGNPFQPDINYRGFVASPLLGTAQGLSVYMDGVRLNQTFGDIVSWDLIPRAAISELQLTPGTNPLFGPNSLGGAVVLSTKDGRFDPGTRLHAAAGPNARRLLELEQGGSAGNGLDWYANANTFDEDGWRADSPSRVRQLFAKGGLLSGDTHLALGAAWSDSTLTGNGLQEQAFLARDYHSVYTKPDVTQNRGTLLNLAASRQWGPEVLLSGNVYYRHIDSATFNGDINDDSLDQAIYQPTAGERTALTAAGYSGFPLSGESAANTPFPSWRCVANVLLDEEPNEKCNALINRTATRQQILGTTAQVSWATSFRGRPQQITAGAAWDHSHVKFSQSTQYGYLTADRGVVTVAGPGAFADGSQNSEDDTDSRVELRSSGGNSSFYAADSVGLTAGLSVTAAARYNRSTVSSMDAITPGGGPGSLDGRYAFQRLNTSLGFNDRISDSLEAYGGYSQGSRAPSAIELGCANVANPCRLPNAMAGDPPLKQVVTDTLEAGVRKISGDFQWSAGIFSAINHDDILFVSASNGLGYFRNVDATRRQGVELAMSAVTGRRAEFSAHYTYLDATYRSSEALPGRGNSSNDAGPGFDGQIHVQPGDRIPLLPRQIFKVSADVTITPQWKLDGDLLAVSDSLARGNDNDQHRPDGVYYLGPGKAGGYATFNLGLTYRPSVTLSLNVQIDNVFDRQYATAAQLGVTGFSANRSFVARPFAAPVIDGARPLRGATFFAPGAPRTILVGLQWRIGR